MVTCKMLWRPRFYVFWTGIALIVMPTALLPEMNSRKMPEQQLLKLADGKVLDAKNDRILCYSSMMQAIAWTYKRSDIQLLNSIGELKYGNERALKAGETPVSFSTKSIAAAIADQERKEAISLISRSRDRFPKEFKKFRKYIQTDRSGSLILWRFPILPKQK